MRTFLRILGLGVVVSLAASGGAARAEGKHSKVTVVNESDWRLDQFFMSPADQDDWGADQLGDAVIATGQRFTLSDVPCDTWDLKVVDEDGDECVVEAVDLCRDNAVWKLTSKALLACQEESN